MHPGEPLTFDGDRVGRRGWMRAGLVALFGSLGATGVLLAVLREEAIDALPYLPVAGTLVWWVCYMVAAIPRRGRVALETDGSLRLSWSRRTIALRDRPIALGRWVGALDTALGVVAYLGHERVRLAGREHTGHGYQLDGPPARRVDFMMTGGDLDRLLATLGVHRDARARDLVIELIPSVLRPRGVLSAVAPWFLTMLIVAGVTGVIAATGLGDVLMADPAGRVALMAGTAALVIGGLAWQIVRSMRVRKSTLALRVGEHELVLVDAARGTIAAAAWRDVRATAFTHRYSTRGFESRMPGYELTLGPHPTIRVGGWDPTQEWPATVPRTRRAAHWLTGAPQWKELVRAIERHRVTPG